MRRNPTVSGSVTATICMTPDSTSRCTRWRTAASERPTAVGEPGVRQAPVLLEPFDDLLVDGVERGARAAAACRFPVDPVPVGHDSRHPSPTMDSVAHPTARPAFQARAIPAQRIPSPTGAASAIGSVTVSNP